MIQFVIMLPKTSGGAYSYHVVSPCLAYNFVVYRLISKLWSTSDHHIQTKCLVQYSGHYLEGYDMVR